MSADTCKVSVVVAAYNAEAFLPTCLNSIVAQTMSDWEVIVVDDQSKDGTAALVRSYTARDGRFRLLQTPRNGGPSAARNIGIEAARGVWVAILDADDRYVPERLQRLSEYGEQAGCDIVSDNPILVTSKHPHGTKMFTHSSMQKAHRVNLEECILANLSKRDEPRVAFGFMKPLMRTAFLKEHAIRYDERLRFSEDFLLYIACMQRGARWDYVPEGMYLYTIRDDSLSGVQSVPKPAELRRLFEFSRDLAASDAAQADPGSKRAAWLYYKKMRRWYSYRSVVEALKVRNLGEAISVLYETPAGIGDVVAEAAVQAPALARKVLRRVPGMGVRA